MSEHFEVTLRMPRRVSEGDIVEVKAHIQHQITTGLQLVETAQTPVERFVRNQPAIYIRSIEIYYDDELVSTFNLNSSTSTDPLLGFMLHATKEASVRLVVTNYEGEVVEVSDDLLYTG